MGLAVFFNDTLVGELNNVETLCHMIISNKLEKATITIPNPYNYSTNLSIEISLSKKTKNSVEIINDYPYINSNIFVEGYVLTLDDTIALLDKENLNILNEAISKYLEQIISDYLYKTSKNFSCDIDNFGQYLLPHHLTLEDWEKTKWLNNYKNSFFSVNVNSNIISGQLFNKF